MKTRNLEASLSNSLGAELSNVGAELLEVGVDSVLNDGVLKNLPIVGSVVGLFKAGTVVKEHLYIKKLLTFLREFSSISENQRISFISEELSDDSKREKFGETMLNLIERNDDLRKFGLFARVFEVHFCNNLSYEDTIRICMMIDRTYYSDLEYIFEFSNGSLDEQEKASELYKSGFLSFSGLDGGTFEDEESGGIIYTINRYGEILKNILNI
jgi:hypothetical protein